MDVRAINYFPCIFPSNVARRSPHKDWSDIRWHSLAGWPATSGTDTSRPTWWQSFRRNASRLFVAFSACFDAVSGMSVLCRSLDWAMRHRQQRTQVSSVPVVPTRRVRFKKGPKRLNKRYINGISPAIGSQVKRKSMSKDDLDKDMEDYRAAASELEFATWLRFPSLLSPRSLVIVYMLSRNNMNVLYVTPL